MLLHKPLRLRLTIQQSDCWPFRSLSIRIPKSEKKWIGVQSYELCARQDGWIGLMFYIPSVQRWKGKGLLMLYQAVWFYYCSMSSKVCPFQLSCLVNYVARKERRSHRGSPRSESGNKYHESWERRSVGLERSTWARETHCSWVWHWAKHAKNNRKAGTQGECPQKKW